VRLSNDTVSHWLAKADRTSNPSNQLQRRMFNSCTPAGQQKRCSVKFYGIDYSMLFHALLQVTSSCSVASDA